MLEEIGFVQNFRETKWQEMYNLAKTYYNYYNNLHINRNFKTVNGYEYDESGVELGKWIFLQKRLIEQGSERERLLTNIGMIWSIRSNLKKLWKYVIDIILIIIRIN